MEWLVSLAKAFSDFIPRPVLVTPDQRIVIFVLGRWPIECGPFFYVIWPLFWSAEVVQISEEVNESQYVIDGVKTRIEIVYRVVDATKSVTECTNASERTRTEVDGHMVERGGEVDLDRLNADCSRFGVEILAVHKTSDGILTVDVNG